MVARSKPATVRRRRERGFTLVEMAVSIVLLAIGVVSAAACMSAATRLSSVSGEYTTAAALAQDQLSEFTSLLASQPDQVSAGDQQGEFGSEHPGYTWQRKIETTDYTELVRVTITISWPGNGNARREAQFVSYERIPQQTTQ